MKETNETITQTIVICDNKDNYALVYIDNPDPYYGGITSYHRTIFKKEHTIYRVEDIIYYYPEQDHYLRFLLDANNDELLVEKYENIDGICHLTAKKHGLISGVAEAPPKLKSDRNKHKRLYIVTYLVNHTTKKHGYIIN